MLEALEHHLILSALAWLLWMAGTFMAYAMGYRDGYTARLRLEYRERRQNASSER